MTAITLDDIIEVAKIESAKMQHFYVGVEHLFIALTKLEGGITPTLLEQTEHSARYLRYATREMAGRGDDRRYWSGYRNSPRANAVLDRARAMLRLTDDNLAPEYALLVAILEERDSIPIRAMHEAGVDTNFLLDLLNDWSDAVEAQAPSARLVGGEALEALSAERQHILRLMFRKYDTVRIEHVFNEGFSGSIVLLVRPVHGDGRTDAPVVVKIDERTAIQWEKKRYDTFVKDTLPPRTARVEGEPILPDDTLIGGLKYTFLRARDEEAPVNLQAFLRGHSPEDIATFLRQGLFESFRETWWGQAQPYTFQVWQEYELVLPPALIVDAQPTTILPPSGHVLRPLGEWGAISNRRVGEIVELEGFTALKTKRERGMVQLAAGAESAAINWSGRIDVYGLDLAQKSYFRGEPMRKIIGKVRQTRREILLEQAHALEPDFSLSDEWLPRLSNFADRLPNPVRRFSLLLERRVAGTLSTIHGDLHMGNVLIGSNKDAWLIDFEWTRDGHTLFDWAVLEMSLLIDYVVTFIGESWDEVRAAITLLDALNRDSQYRDGAERDAGESLLARALLPIAELRRIVRDLLYVEPQTGRNNWAEYYLALALCALRVLGWGNRPLAARRLAFMVAAAAMAHAQAAEASRNVTSADLTTDQGMLGGSLMG
jgi:hypothetical protein